MHKISLICIGGLREQWAKEAAKLYLDRLKHAFDFRVTELVPSHQPNASGQKVEESERLLISAQKTGGVLWILDESGNEMTSQEFAQEIETLRDRGEPITVILGGSYGLTDNVRSAGRKVISLSKMTLPHELCRIVFFEQLYRASEILKGSGYHH
jgi:23S rRNA (pseudouridine1915-N3)-methyltransferase